MPTLTDLIASLTAQGIQVLDGTGLRRAGLWLDEHDVLILSRDMPDADLMAACHEVSLGLVRPLSA